MQVADLGFAGHNVVVTGGTSGIGFAIAGAFAEEGAGIGIIGRSPERLQSALVALRENHPGRLIVGGTCDVADEGALQPVMHEVVSQLGGLDHRSTAQEFQVPSASPWTRSQLMNLWKFNG